MTCQECELLLAGEERDAAVDGHLSTCAACREFELELRGNAEALAAMAAEPMPVVVRPRPLRWPYVAAVAIAALLILMFAIPKKQTTLPITAATAAPQAAIAAPEPERPVIHHARKHSVQAGEPQILQVKMLTADPSVVIYWQIETRGTE